MTTSTLVRAFASSRLVLSALALSVVGLVPGCQGDIFTPIADGGEGRDGATPTSAPAAPPGEATQADEQDIVGGNRDYGHPAVVALIVGGNKLCTGTLIGPRTVLTAHHCVAPTVDAISCPPEISQVGANVDPRTIVIVQGSDVDTGKIVAKGTAVFAPDSDAICEEDLALVVLDRVVAGTRPLRLSETSIAIGDKTVAVGFGRTSNEGGAGKKRARRDVLVVGVSDDELRVGEASCHGDSGGPLLDATGRVLGVLSRGGPGCEGAVENTYTRVSAFSDLIAAALAVPE